MFIENLTRVLIVLDIKYVQVTETYYVIKFYIVLKRKMNKYSHLKVKSVWVLLWTLFNFFFSFPSVSIRLSNII